MTNRERVIDRIRQTAAALVDVEKHANDVVLHADQSILTQLDNLTIKVIAREARRDAARLSKMLGQIRREKTK